jgi:hypothetical protein
MVIFALLKRKVDKSGYHIGVIQSRLAEESNEEHR